MVDFVEPTLRTDWGFFYYTNKRISKKNLKSMFGEYEKFFKYRNPKELITWEIRNFFNPFKVKQLEIEGCSFLGEQYYERSEKKRNPRKKTRELILAYAQMQDVVYAFDFKYSAFLSGRDILFAQNPMQNRVNGIARENDSLEKQRKIHELYKKLRRNLTPLFGADDRWMLIRAEEG